LHEYYFQIHQNVACTVLTNQNFGVLLFLDQPINLLDFEPTNQSLVSCREFGHRDDANAWRKSSKEADKDKICWCILESKALSMHLRHYLTNSR